jgi:hypothetical protein
VLHRFQKIQRDFGTTALLKVILLLAGLVGLALLGLFAGDSLLAAYVALGGLVLGYFLRTLFAAGIEYYGSAFRTATIIYGIVLFLGDRLGLEPNWKVLIITVTTVIVFNFNFWGLSDPEVINLERLPVQLDEQRSKQNEGHVSEDAL